MRTYTQNDLETAILYKLNEEVVPYLVCTNEPAPQLIDMLTDKLLVNQCIENGLPFTMFEEIQKYSPFNDTEWAELLELSTKSLQRYKSDKDFRFKVLQSAKIMEILEIVIKGHDLFGSREAFEHWFSTSSFALGGKKPVDLIKTSYGQQLVLTELTHIDHGIFS